MPSSSSSIASKWAIKTSVMAQNTFNPIRNILETMVTTPNPEKEMISLSIGDPTVFGNLKPPFNIISAVKKTLDSGKWNGYGPSIGYAEARKAVAEYRSIPGAAEINENDVILCSGCSSALDLCISVLGNPNKNFLVPCPSFPLYATLAKGLGIQVKEYKLIPENGWEADLNHLESLIDEDTVGIIVTNPSNPCGSVYSRKHLQSILDIAERNYLPIIADEIYEHFVFPGHEYVPIASLTSTVPVLSCGGLTKRYLIPGWRIGWITIHDRNQLFKNAGIRDGLVRLSQRIIGCNTLIQGSLPAILKETPQHFFKDTIDFICRNAELAFRLLKTVPGLTPLMPAGAMYMMVRVDMSCFMHFDTDLSMVEGLIREESVFPLPGKCFNIPNFFRIVLTVPEHMLKEACERIRAFCIRHSTRDKLRYGSVDSAIFMEDRNSLCGNSEEDDEDFYMRS